MFKKKNHSSLWALINVTPCYDEENRYIGSFAMLTDVTERIKNEEEIRKLNRVYSVLSEVNQAIVREKDKKQLMDDVCRIAVEQGGFKMSWVGFVDPVSKNVIPYSKYGYEEGYLDQIRISVLEIPTGKGPTGTAIRENRHIFCNDLKNDPLMSPWKEEQMKRGYLSSCSLPLKLRNSIIGAFTIYSGEINFFNESEIKLLKEMAGDISFALENIELDKINKEIENEILNSKQRIEQILGSISDGFFTLNREWQYSYINTQGANMVGKTPVELIGNRIMDVFPEVKESKYYEIYSDVMNNRITRNFEEFYEPLKSWYSGTVYPYTDGISIIFQNITDKKIKEEELVKSLKEKDVMLREIYHRVKNNLQVISSLLKMQSKYAKDEQTSEFFNISQLRVKSMALVHEKLYRSQDLSNIDFDDYIRKLTVHLLQSYGVTKNEIQLKIDAKNVYLTIENAIPCGLLINEMVSNSIKHAFPDKRKGEIYIHMFLDNDNRYNLSVKDNGIGFPSNIDYRNSTSLGSGITGYIDRAAGWRD